jgi:diguanylate cyclase (GGDEF)-like protein
MLIDFRFAPAEEAKFVAHMKAEQRTSALICTCTALVVWIPLICLDFIRVDWLQELGHGHADAAVMIAMRMVTLGVLLTTAWALFFHWERYPSLTFLAVVTLALSASVIVSLYKLRGAPAITMAEFAILMAVFLPLGFTFQQSLYAALIVTITVTVTGLVFLPASETTKHLQFSVMLAFTGFIGSVGAALRERSHREQFLMRRLLHEQATTDMLTNLGNRRWFEEQAEQALAEAKTQREFFHLAVLDVDDFKRFNDHYGHQAGDRALQSLGHALKTGVGDSRCYIGRIGGEEFAIAARGLKGEAFRQLLRSLLDAVEGLAIPHEKSTVASHLTMSIGAATAGADDTFETLYRRADLKLYDAKTKGRNRCLIDDKRSMANPESSPAPNPERGRVDKPAAA